MDDTWDDKSVGSVNAHLQDPTRRATTSNVWLLQASPVSLESRYTSSARPATTTQQSVALEECS